MRSYTDKAKVEAFLQALGQRVRGGGRIYLTGGATALLCGWRQSTIDVDIKADPEPAGFFEAIADLKDELDVNVELASPDLFIPELPGWRERSHFISRIASVDFFHFDFYSQVLAKLERGHDRDKLDVLQFKHHGLISLDRLIQYFEQIRPALKKFPAIEEKVFEQRVREFCEEA